VVVVVVGTLGTCGGTPVFVSVGISLDSILIFLVSVLISGMELSSFFSTVDSAFGGFGTLGGTPVLDSIVISRIVLSYFFLPPVGIGFDGG
jgi:hypothetical protein